MRLGAITESVADGSASRPYQSKNARAASRTAPWFSGM